MDFGGQWVELERRKCSWLSAFCSSEDTPTNSVSTNSLGVNSDTFSTVRGTVNKQASLKFWHQRHPSWPLKNVLSQVLHPSYSFLFPALPKHVLTACPVTQICGQHHSLSLPSLRKIQPPLDNKLRVHNKLQEEQTPLITSMLDKGNAV